ncbi:MAG: amidohydrolase family protein [Bacteroidota bacterium]
MRKFKADIVYTLSSSPIENGLVVTDDNGTILQVKQYESEENVEVLQGAICPGFVNTHCHLELSYLQNKLCEKKGLHEFIKEIEALKQPASAEIEEAINTAYQKMYANGIVAVGDICNTNDTLNVKLKSQIYFHNFVEVFAFHPDRAEAAFAKGKKVYDTFIENKLNASIVPHAPYSVSDKLWKLITDLATENNSILSIHNQENEDENLLFTQAKGKILERLKSFGIDTSFWKSKGINSLQYVLQFLPQHLKSLLVHNTFTTENDIENALKTHANLWWCFCPNANLYIENKLPNYSVFKKQLNRLTVGTDSLASNHDLCVLSELKIIAKHAAIFSTQDLLQIACANGARFLGIEKQFGTIEIGKKPGLVLLKNLEQNNISQQSTAQRLV